MQKKQQTLKNKRIINIQMSAEGAQFSHLACRGGKPPSLPPLVRPLALESISFKKYQRYSWIE